MKKRKMNVYIFAIFQASIFTLLGLFAGILYSFGGLIIDILISLNLIVSTESPGLSYGTLLAFGALAGMPLVLGVIGFLLGALEAILYNLIAFKLKFLKLNFEELN